MELNFCLCAENRRICSQENPSRSLAKQTKENNERKRHAALQGKSINQPIDDSDSNLPYLLQLTEQHMRSLKGYELKAKTACINI